ncbi:MAG: hypothetical protein ACK4VZ_05600 [Paracoccaceae bacterium]
MPPPDGVMEMFTSANSVSRTIAVTLPDGKMCPVATDQGQKPTIGDFAAKERKI